MINIAGILIISAYTVIVGTILKISENVVSTPEMRREMHLFY